MKPKSAPIPTGGCIACDPSSVNQERGENSYSEVGEWSGRLEELFTLEGGLCPSSRKVTMATSVGCAGVENCAPVAAVSGRAAVGCRRRKGFW